MATIVHRVGIKASPEAGSGVENAAKGLRPFRYVTIRDNLS